MAPLYRFSKFAILLAPVKRWGFVPASALPYRDTLREILSDLPKGGVLLCHSGQDPKQDRILKCVEERFRDHGHAVINLTLPSDVSGTLKTR